MSKDCKTIFEDYMDLKQHIQMLASIVQNPSLNITEGQLDGFSMATDSVINKLNKLRVEVIKLYK